MGELWVPLWPSGPVLAPRPAPDLSAPEWPGLCAGKGRVAERQRTRSGRQNVQAPDQREPRTPHLCPPPRKFAAENSGTPHPPALPHCPPGEDANLEYLLTVFMGCAFRLVGIIFGTVVSCDASHINFLVLGLACCSELWLGPPFDIPPRPLSDSLPVLTSAGLLEWGMLSLGGPENLIASSGS